MDCPHRIPPLGTPATHHKSYKRHHARLSLRHHHKDRDRWGDPDHSPTTEDITAGVIIEAALDHNTRIDAATTEAAHDNLTQPTEDTATDLTVTDCTGHIADHPNVKALWVINPEIAVGHNHNHPTDLQCTNYTDKIHTPVGWEKDHIQRGT